MRHSRARNCAPGTHSEAFKQQVEAVVLEGCARLQAMVSLRDSAVSDSTSAYSLQTASIGTASISSRDRTPRTPSTIT